MYDSLYFSLYQYQYQYLYLWMDIYCCYGSFYSLPINRSILISGRRVKAFIPFLYYKSLYIYIYVYISKTSFFHPHLYHNLTYHTNVGDSFRYTESIDAKRRVRMISTSSCPNHYSICQHSYCGGLNNSMALVKNTVYEVPLYPMFASVIKDTTCTTKPVAIAHNGVPILGPDDSDTSNTRICTIPGNYGSKAVSYDFASVHASDGRSSCPIDGPTGM